MTLRYDPKKELRRLYDRWHSGNHDDLEEDLHQLSGRVSMKGGVDEAWEVSYQSLRVAVDEKNWQSVSPVDSDDAFERRHKVSSTFIIRTSIALDRGQEPPPLRRLIRVADLLPIPTRKAIKALAGDYMDEVQRLHGEGRPRMAQWNVVLAWGCAAWYLLRSPFDWVVSYVLKNLRGSSQ